MNRRKFLKYTFRASLVAAGSMVVAQVVRATSYPARVVQRKLEYLDLSVADLERFSRDYAQFIPSVLKHQLDSIAVAPLIFRGLTVLGFKNQVAELEEHICRVFLLSTDFFRKGALENQPLHYIQFYDPHRVACQNPFARFEIETDK